MNVDPEMKQLLPVQFFFSHHKQFQSNLWHIFCAIVTACLIILLVTKLNAPVIDSSGKALKQPPK